MWLTFNCNEPTVKRSQMENTKDLCLFSPLQTLQSLSVFTIRRILYICIPFHLKPSMAKMHYCSRVIILQWHYKMKYFITNAYKRYHIRIIVRSKKPNASYHLRYVVCASTNKVYIAITVYWVWTQMSMIEYMERQWLFVKFFSNECNHF